MVRHQLTPPAILRQSCGLSCILVPGHQAARAILSRPAAPGPIFTAGLAGLVAGAVSMALGEYVSVSSQRDSEHAQIAQEKRELASTPEAELTELTALYEAKGLSAETARTVAVELTSHNALAAHLEAELHIDPADIPNPMHAAGASALSFVVGALLPMLAIMLPPAGWRVPVAYVAVLIAPAWAAATSAVPSCGSS